MVQTSVSFWTEDAVWQRVYDAAERYEPVSYTHLKGRVEKTLKNRDFPAVSVERKYLMHP